jgi:hypothetical protein
VHDVLRVLSDHLFREVLEDLGQLGWHLDLIG